MDVDQRSLPYMDTEDGLSPYTGKSRGPGPLTLSRELWKAYRAGDLDRVRQIEAMPRCNWDRAMSLCKLDAQGTARRSDRSVYVLPVISRVDICKRITFPEVFYTSLVSQIVHERDKEAFKQYIGRPHFVRADMEITGRFLGRVMPRGTVLWCAAQGMPTLPLMTGAMENGNCGVLLGLIDHLERHPPKNPHEIGLWMQKNPLPPWWGGTPAIEGRLKAIMFRGPLADPHEQTTKRSRLSPVEASIHGAVMTG